MSRIIGIAIAVATTSVWSICLRAETPADTVATADVLQELTVTQMAPRRLLKVTDGEMNISAAQFSEFTSVLGSNDMLGLLRSLPAVATSNELSASLSVRGMDNGANYFSTDGVRIINPLHLLGLYSTFIPAYYRAYSFASGRFDATQPNFTGGSLRAFSGAEVDTVFHGSVTAGLLESHIGVRTPLMKGKTSLSFGVRQTYLNQIYPNLLKFNGSSLRYSFTDANLGFRWQPTVANLIGVNFFYSRDNIDLIFDEGGEKNGTCSWQNFCGGIEWIHDLWHTNLGVSHFDNKFQLAEGGRLIDIPSSLTQVTLSARRPLGNFLLESDLNYRHASGQSNRAAANVPRAGESDAVEWNVAGKWRRTLFERLTVDVGLRVAVYHCGTFNRMESMPRLDLSWRFLRSICFYASYGRLIQFDKLVEESAASLPADFRINADGRFRPQNVNTLEAGFEGKILPLSVDFSLGGYWRFIRHAAEFNGSFVNLAGNSYNPLNDLLDGRGYSCGVSVMLMRQFGRVRGRAGYTLGKSRLKFAELGDHYFPSAHDRLHDLNASLTWEPVIGLTFTTTFTHATGLPFTKAKYGYMIGDNLICEYYPHNSSRLPDYNRLDLSVNYKFGKGKLRHQINLSLYNALASDNVLFYYSAYKADHGIVNRSPAMDIIIPSVSYTVTIN